MCCLPARRETGATWILNASREVQKPCAQDTKSEIFPSSRKIRNAFGNKWISLHATDTRQSGPSGRDRADDDATIPDCSKYVSFSSALNPSARGGHGSGRGRDRLAHARDPPGGPRLYMSCFLCCSRSAASRLLFRDQSRRGRTWKAQSISFILSPASKP